MTLRNGEYRFFRISDLHEIETKWSELKQAEGQCTLRNLEEISNYIKKLQILLLQENPCSLWRLKRMDPNRSTKQTFDIVYRISK